MAAQAEVIVKVTTQHPSWPLLRQSPQRKGRWGRYRFVVDEDLAAADAWIVCEGLQKAERTVCPRERTVLVTWEPPGGVRPPYARAFLDQFASVLTCRRDLRHRRVRLGLQGHPWFVERSYDELVDGPMPADKPVELVGITSSKSFSRGHRSRLQLLRGLKDRFGDRMLLVGRGIEDFDRKWDVLGAARYAVIAENFEQDDWITEKLPDAFLAGAFPFYNGAPNAGSWFDNRSFIAIPLDVDIAARRIAATLDDPDHYDMSRPYVLASRRRYLDELQFFPLMAAFLDDLTRELPASTPSAVDLLPERPPSWQWRLAKKLTGI